MGTINLEIPDLLTLCLLVKCCLLIFFSKSTFLKNSFRNTIRVSNTLDLAQAQCFVGPDLGPNCLQRLSTDDINKTRVFNFVFCSIWVEVDLNTVHKLCGTGFSRFLLLYVI